jgi:hypothetical protein
MVTKTVTYKSAIFKMIACTSGFRRHWNKNLTGRRTISKTMKMMMILIIIAFCKTKMGASMMMRSS